MYKTNETEQMCPMCGSGMEDHSYDYDGINGQRVHSDFRCVTCAAERNRATKRIGPPVEFVLNAGGPHGSSATNNRSISIPDFIRGNGVL